MTGRFRAIASRLPLGAVVLLLASGIYLLLDHALVLGSTLDLHLLRAVRGFMASALVAVVVVWYLAMRREPSFSPSSDATGQRAVMRNGLCTCDGSHLR